MADRCRMNDSSEWRRRSDPNTWVWVSAIVFALGVLNVLTGLIQAFVWLQIIGGAIVSAIAAQQFVYWRRRR